MTTTVLIGTQGNKEVSIDTPNGRIVLSPGRWFTLGIHGEQTLTLKETGGFVDAGPSYHNAPAGESATPT